MTRRTTPTKVALCVGVNKYRYHPESNLSGCANDARDMAALLRGRGFTVSVLLDYYATRDAILTRLAALVAAPGLSHIAFSMSSHGTQIYDASGDEDDRLDEAVCPSDVRWGAGRFGNLIVDDEFRALFAKLPGETVIDVFLDACYSGTGVRALSLVAGSRPRYMPPPSIEACERVMAYQVRRERALGDNVILWSGCTDVQTSADAYIGGRFRGAFTAGFLQSFERSKTRKALIADTVARCRRYGQTPQLESAAKHAAVPPWGWP